MIKDIILQSLENSISYNQYLKIIDQKVIENSTTGKEKTQVLAEYTKLNQRRMKRWNKTVKISEVHSQQIKSFKAPVTWLVITESWCGDAAHLIPVIAKVASLNPHISLKLVLRDEHPKLMNAFLTNGGKAIPKLIMLDEHLNVLNTFGPRPSKATAMVNNYKAKHGTLSAEFKEELQHWYNKDKGQSTINDLVSLLH